MNVALNSLLQAASKSSGKQYFESVVGGVEKSPKKRRKEAEASVSEDSSDDDKTKKKKKKNDGDVPKRPRKVNVLAPEESSESEAEKHTSKSIVKKGVKQRQREAMSSSEESSDEQKSKKKKNVGSDIEKVLKQRKKELKLSVSGDLSDESDAPKQTGSKSGRADAKKTVVQVAAPAESFDERMTTVQKKKSVKPPQRQEISEESSDESDNERMNTVQKKTSPIKKSVKHLQRQEVSSSEDSTGESERAEENRKKKNVTESITKPSKEKLSPFKSHLQKHNETSKQARPLQRLFANKNTSLYLLKLPNDVDPKNLIGKSIPVNTHSKIKLGHKEKLEMGPKEQTSSTYQLLAPWLFHMGQIEGVLYGKRHIRVKSETAEPIIKNFEVERSVKERHPIFGSSFSEEMGMEEAVVERLESPEKIKKKKRKKELARAEEEEEDEIAWREQQLEDARRKLISKGDSLLYNADDVEEPPKKKKKKKKKQVELTEDTETEQMAVFSEEVDVETSEPKKKKKKKKEKDYGS